MALAYINEIEERIEVSACPLNFGEDDILEQADLLFMDGFAVDPATGRTRWVLGEALDQCRAWEQTGRPMPVADYLNARPALKSP